MQPDSPDWRICFALLPKVSRTFALSITLLKPPMRNPVCMGYLLCRLIDTFEDASTLSTPQKAAYIEALQAFVSGRAIPEPDWAQSAAQTLAGDANPSDLELLEHLDAVLGALGTLPLKDREPLNRCFEEMATGMIAMQHLLDQSPTGVRMLPSMASLTCYCHYVAGVVGTMLTELIAQKSPWLTPERKAGMLDRAEAFGQFLQKINILKDIPADMQKGWCFIPQETITQAGLAPGELLDAPLEARIRAIVPVTREVLEHLIPAWQYLMLVPVEEREYRLFLAYSLFFGVKTLELGLREPDRSFEASRPLKISRLEVAAIIEKLNRLIDDPARLERYLCDLLEATPDRLDPRWPREVRQALENLLGHLQPVNR